MREDTFEPLEMISVIGPTGWVKSIFHESLQGAQQGYKSYNRLKVVVELDTYHYYCYCDVTHPQSLYHDPEMSRDAYVYSVPKAPKTAEEVRIAEQKLKDMIYETAFMNHVMTKTCEFEPQERDDILQKWVEVILADSFFRFR